MRYIDRITEKEKSPDGMSPAEVYRCQLDGATYYLKMIDKLFSNTTYSVRREAEVMQWLADKLHVPALLEYGQVEEKEYLIMGEIKGRHIDDFAGTPMQYLTYLVKALRQLWSVDISRCGFSSRLDFRLQELNYLLEHHLADVNMTNWQDTTDFAGPEELYSWLCNNRPPEELAFSHGDIGANFFIVGEEPYFYDLARCGVADKWLDIAFCVRDIRDYYPGTEYERIFFEMLGIEPDYRKIEYYILLDEMF